MAGHVVKLPPSPAVLQEKFLALVYKEILLLLQRVCAFFSSFNGGMEKTVVDAECLVEISSKEQEQMYAGMG